MDFREVGITGIVREGYNYLTCPECSHTRTKKSDKCLTVHKAAENNWWKCHHCGFSGNLENHAASKLIREHARVPKSQIQQYHPEVLALFQEKSIDTRVAISLGWYDVVSKKNTSQTVYLAIPIYGLRGQLYNVKFRNLNNPNESKHSQVPRNLGSVSTLIGLNALEVDPDTGTIKELIICEGETDLATWKRLHKNVVSVPMGAPSPTAKDFDKEFEYLSHESFEELRKIVESYIITADGDPAGNVLTNELVNRLGKKVCKVVKYPEGTKDANEVYLTYGIDGLTQLKDSAETMSFEGIINPMDLLYEIDQIDKYGIESGKPIGLKCIDDLYTLKAPYVYVITGVPASGKSTFNRFHYVNYVKLHEAKVALYTPEQRPYAREVIKMCEVYCQKPFNTLNDQEKVGAIEWVSKHFDFVVPTPASYKELTRTKNQGEENRLTAILEYIEILKMTKNISGYVIDAWNKIEHEIPRGDTMHNYIGKSLDAIINFNSENNLWCVIVAHPRKPDVKTSGNFQAPSLYHISDSAHWFNKADVGIIVHRDKYVQQEDGTYDTDYNAPTMVKTEKVKFEELGREGKTELTFINECNSFAPVGAIRDNSSKNTQDVKKFVHDVVGKDPLPINDDLFSDYDNEAPF